MKVTKRMKKILLFLMHPESASKWLEERKIGFSGQEYFTDYQIWAFCENRHVSGANAMVLSLGKEISYKRTFRILKRLGLIESMLGYLPSYRLTNEGEK